MSSNDAERPSILQASEELQRAWDFIENTDVSVFLTGKAGTGKTTFLHDLVSRSSKTLAVVAPSGVAAINAGGVTIHSFFQLPLSPFIPGIADESSASIFRATSCVSSAPLMSWS